MIGAHICMSSLNVLNALGMKPFCRCLMYLMCDNILLSKILPNHKKVSPLVKTGYIDDLACLLKAQPVRLQENVLCPESLVQQPLTSVTSLTSLTSLSLA